MKKIKKTNNQDVSKNKSAIQKLKKLKLKKQKEVYQAPLKQQSKLKN